jgi:cytoplasmic iron level regulating protein YaaA (DUF328/UPF0246 family)
LLILLPPSETKRSGGVGISIVKLAIIWAALDPARDQLIDALQSLCADSALATKALGLGKQSANDLAANLELRTAPTLPAVLRYNGVLFEALDYPNLSESAKQRVTEKLFIQSALFGLLPASEQIPYYRFSASSSLPGVNLKKVWTEAHAAVWPRMIGPILDMRSNAYVDLNPVPEANESYFVEIFDSSGKAMNHFNKKAKGVLTRAALERNLESVEQLPEIAKTVNLIAEVNGRSVRVTTPKGF